MPNEEGHMNRFENNPYFRGYQPRGPKLDVTNPPRGGSGVPDLTPNSKLRTPNCTILTTPERIVRDYRSSHVAAQREKPSNIFEHVIKIFLWITIGWGIGYFHHFLTTVR